jgi:acetyl-CoA carboxylase biotin carboxyl carrier protein
VRSILSEMVANVWKVVVRPGDVVSAGDALVILESMKMEIPVKAPAAGTVTEVRVEEGGLVQEGDVIAVIEEGEGRPGRAT